MMEALRVEEEFDDFLEENGIDDRDEASLQECSEWLDGYIKQSGVVE